jgi:multicomponent Na+:H+ antiporter subunit F
MSELLFVQATVVLLAVAASLIRILLGPRPADRMMGAQLAGTAGIAVLMLLSTATRTPAVIDVALVLALLAAFATVAFVKARSHDGAGDPEERPPS